MLYSEGNTWRQTLSENPGYFSNLGPNFDPDLYMLENQRNIFNFQLIQT